jgi:hypothetical protein
MPAAETSPHPPPTPVALATEAAAQTRAPIDVSKAISGDSSSAVVASPRPGSFRELATTLFDYLVATPLFVVLFPLLILAQLVLFALPLGFVFASDASAGTVQLNAACTDKLGSGGEAESFPGLVSPAPSPTSLYAARNTARGVLRAGI